MRAVNKLLLVTIVSIIGLLLTIQVVKVPQLSSDVDDIGVYLVIKRALENKINVVNQMEHAGVGYVEQRIAEKLGANTSQIVSNSFPPQVLMLFGKTYLSIREHFEVPRSFTYAPAPYLVTHYFIDGDEKYSTAKLKIRFMSKLSWLVGLAITFWLMIKVDTSKYKFASFFILVFIVNSLQQISYSAHASSYAFGLISSALAIKILAKQLDGQSIKFLDTLVLLLVCAMQYQLVPLVLLFFLYYLSKSAITLIKDSSLKSSSIRELSNCVFFALAFAVMVVPFLLPNLGRGKNWNVGIHNEFTLQDNYSDLLSEFGFSNLVATIIEIFRALLISFSSLFSAFSYEGQAKYYLGFALVILLLPSVKAVPNLRHLGGVKGASVAILAVHLCLYLLNVFTMSPTRHIIYLTTPLAILATIGLSNLASKVRLSATIGLVTTLLTLLTFSVLSIKYFEKRHDPFEQLADFVFLNNSKHPKLLVNTDWTYQHYAIPALRDSNQLLDLNLQAHKPEPQPPEQLLDIKLAIENATQELSLFRISHWSPANDNEIEHAVSTVCRETIKKENCDYIGTTNWIDHGSDVSTEWATLIQGYENRLFVEEIKIRLE